MNWIDAGCVGPVVDATTCSASWAFAATAAVEGAQCAGNNNNFLLSLSVQQLVDCSSDYGNYGCSGTGWYYYAFDYLKTHGFQSIFDYPYTGKDAVCTYS